MRLYWNIRISTLVRIGKDVEEVIRELILAKAGATQSVMHLKMEIR